MARNKKLTLYQALYGQKEPSEDYKNFFEAMAIFLVEIKHPREALALSLAYGYDGLGIKTYDEMGRMLTNASLGEGKPIPITREPARALWNKGHRILRNRPNYRAYINKLFRIMQNEKDTPTQTI